MEIHPLDSILTIDCKYLYPEFDAAYLIIEDDCAAFVDNGTAHSHSQLLAALREFSSPEQVQYIIITHVHLDHAGGTSALIKACPNAIVLAHERAARHIIDPDRLIQGTVSVYGEHNFNRYFGNIEPVAETKVRIVRDGETVTLGTRKLTFIYTPGHANHHQCIHDSKTNAIFTGDALGLAYPRLQSGRKLFVFPSTTPTDFNPDKTAESIDAILNTGADVAFITHFGMLSEIQSAAEMMKTYLKRNNAIIMNALKQDLKGDDLYRFCHAGVHDYLVTEIEQRGIPFSPDIQDFLSMDIELNAQGIAVAVGRLRN